MLQLAAMRRGRPAGTLGKKDLHVCPLIVDDSAHFLQAARRLQGDNEKRGDVDVQALIPRA